MKKFKKILRSILVIVFLLSAIYTAFAYYKEQKDDEVYNDLDKYIQNTEPTEPVEIPMDISVTLKDPIFEKVKSLAINIKFKAPLPIIINPEAEIAYKEFKEYQIKYDWETLLAKNDEIVGWLYIPDNEYINLPVVQGSNNDYYLNHDYTKKWNANGAAFVDYKYHNLCLSKVIYGHNMNRDSRKPVFTSLTMWREEEYFNSHRTLYYTDANGVTCKYFIFALAGLNVKDDKVFDYLKMFFETEDDLRTWLDYLKDKSIYFDLGENTVEYRANELMILSTCDRRIGYGKDSRLVFFCVNVTNNKVDLNKINLENKGSD